MTVHNIPRLAIVLLIAVPAFGAGLVVSAAASSSTPKVFYACLKGGTLSKDSNSSVKCGSDHREVVWDEIGPQGPKGNTGPPGPGAVSVYQPESSGGTLSGSIDLTAGSWIVSDVATGGFDGLAQSLDHFQGVTPSPLLSDPFQFGAKWTGGVSA